MGLTNSTHTPISTLFYVIRTIFAIDSCDRSDNSPTKDVSVETLRPELTKNAYKKEILRRYNGIIQKKKLKGIPSTEIVIPAKSLNEVTVAQSSNVEIGKLEKNDTLDNLNILENVFLVSQWYTSINGNSYGITIDTKNEEIMSNLEGFSKESCYGISEDSACLVELQFEKENGEVKLLKFNKWDPKTLEVLSNATFASTQRPPIVKYREEKKDIYSFVFVDRLGRNIYCSLDINNINVLKKLKSMEEWALVNADPDDLFDIKLNDTTTFQLDLKNQTTIRNLKSLKEESIDGVPRKLINPKLRKEMNQKGMQTELKYEQITQPATINLFSPYTGHFTAIFDLNDQQTMMAFKNFTEEFKNTLYQYIVTINTVFNGVHVIKLDLANPKIVYELIKMTQKYSEDVVSFNPKLILNNLITFALDDGYLTIDISKSIVYGGLFDISNRNKKGVKLTVPFEGNLIDFYIDIKNPSIVSKIRSFSLATINLNSTKTFTLTTLIFLKTSAGLKPLCLDLSDKKVITQICNLTRGSNKGELLTYLEIVDNNGQFITISIDLNDSIIVDALSLISKPGWFVGINATESPYFTICFPYERRYKSVKMKLKPSIIDELAQLFNKYCPSYSILEVFDALKRSSILYINPTLPNLIDKIFNITDAVQILKPTQENSLTIYNPLTNKFIDLDLSTAKTKEVFTKFQMDYQPMDPLTVVKYYEFDKENFYFIHINEEFLNEIEKVQVDLGQHVVIENKTESILSDTIKELNDHKVTVISEQDE